MQKTNNDIEKRVEIYDLNSEMITIDTVKNFYSKVDKNFEKDGIVSQKVKTVMLILMNQNGEIYVQKRKENKIQSIGKYDKTIGGHVSVGDGFSRSLIRECGYNLGVSALLVESQEDFYDMAKSSDLNKMAICKKLDYFPNFMSKKVTTKGERFSQPYMAKIYIGYYNGEISFINGKDSKIEPHSLKDLEERLENDPYELTYDLKFMLSQYKDMFIPLI